MEKRERKVSLERKTHETAIDLKLNIDGNGAGDVFTGIGFFDHMLLQIAKHGCMDLSIHAQGDIEVDYHHTVEDVGIVLGKAIAEALGAKEGISRYGSVILPMEEALILCAVDLSGRPYLGFDVTFGTERVGGLDTEMIEEFFRAVSLNAGINMHIKQLSGKNSHHLAEATFKAFGRAIDQASRIDKRIDGVLSTKGMLE
jgi:imidazoleglycerol-phosphate dehydratase